MCNIIINTFYINTFYFLHNTFINTFYINTSVKSVDNNVTNWKIFTIIKILAIFIFSSKSITLALLTLKTLCPFSHWPQRVTAKDTVTGTASSHNLHLRDEQNKETSFLLQEAKTRTPFYLHGRIRIICCTSYEAASTKKFFWPTI